MHSIYYFADINECETGKHHCDSNAFCNNTKGSYICTCKPGYNGNGVNCTDFNRRLKGSFSKNYVVLNNSMHSIYYFADINECETGKHHCDSNAFCNNTKGSYICTCKPGYNGNGVNCTDFNRRLKGSFSKNYIVLNNSMHSIYYFADINECETGKHHCDSNAFCNNTKGSYICTCKPGYNGNGVNCTDFNRRLKGSFSKNYIVLNNSMHSIYYFADINECETGKHHCDSNAFCNNTKGSYICTCKPGYNGNGVNCTDFNRRLKGSFSKNYIVLNNSMHSIYYFADINECETGKHHCDSNAFCNNTKGSYICTCKPGYNGNGVNCTDFNRRLKGSFSKNYIVLNNSMHSIYYFADINECETGKHHCDSNAFCNNTKGSYICTCKPGYNGNGVNCTDFDRRLKGSFSKNYIVLNNSMHSIYYFADINECETGKHHCDSNAFCNNTKGSYICTCKPGYNGNGVNCTDFNRRLKGSFSKNYIVLNNSMHSIYYFADINECETGKHHCDSNAFCNNTKGSYICTCKPGYNGNGVNCTDFNRRLKGSFSKNYIVLNNSMHSIYYFADINECETGKHHCDSNAFCNNTKGSYICTCKPGYNGNGVNCTDVNECVTGKHNCNGSFICHNTKGSFRCICSPKYFGVNCTAFMDSNILKTNYSYLSHLGKFLEPAVGYNSQWLLCWRATLHGWNVRTQFHRRCDGKRDTV
ncbi:unnamed protein product, partial [Porites lobata]